MTRQADYEQRQRAAGKVKLVKWVPKALHPSCHKALDKFVREVGEGGIASPLPYVLYALEDIEQHEAKVSEFADVVKSYEQALSDLLQFSKRRCLTMADREAWETIAADIQAFQSRILAMSFPGTKPRKTVTFDLEAIHQGL